MTKMLKEKEIQVHKEISPLAKSGKMLYMATDDIISLSLGAKTEFVRNSHPFFGQLLELLPRSEEFILEFNENKSLISQLVDLVYVRILGEEVVSYSEDGSAQVNGVRLDPYLAGRIIDFKQRGVAYQPLLAFAFKVQGNTNLSYQDRQWLISVAGTKEAPLTLCGDIILYQRSSRILVPDSKPIQSFQDFFPDCNLPKITSGAKAINLSLLSNAASLCTDTGVLHEFEVNPLAIRSCFSLKSAFVVDTALDLGVVPEATAVGKTSISYRAFHFNGIVYREPHGRDTALAALKIQGDCSPVSLEYQQSGC